MPRRPWDSPKPQRLYKYLHPDRAAAIGTCHLRFGLRTSYGDQAEFTPKVLAFGTEAEIRSFVERDIVLADMDKRVMDLAIAQYLDPAQREDRATNVQRMLKSPDEYGMLCLTDNPKNDRMWEEYAHHEQGFALEFTVTVPTVNLYHPGFWTLIAKKGKLGIVTYSDKPLASFLAEYGVDVFYRKSTKYSFESEWRLIRGLDSLENIHGMYIGRYNPTCLSSILIKRSCVVHYELEFIIRHDPRFQHVKLIEI